MKIILIALMFFILAGCATRRKVLFNKTTQDRWGTVDNPEDFLSEKENKFLSKK